MCYNVNKILNSVVKNIFEINNGYLHICVKYNCLKNIFSDVHCSLIIISEYQKDREWY